MSTNASTVEEVGGLFSELADQARVLRVVLLACIDSSDVELAAAGVVLCERLGMLADEATRLCGAMPSIGGMRDWITDGHAVRAGLAALESLRATALPNAVGVAEAKGDA